MINNSHPGLRKLLIKFEGEFQEGFRAVLPQVSYVYHALEVDGNERKPHRPFLHLSPA